MKTASAKNKGRLFQQLVRSYILKLLKRYGVEPEDVKSTSMGAGGKDITFSPYAKSLLPIAVECKSHKSFAVYNIVDQAKYNAKPDEQPVVFLKANHKDPLVVISIDYYMELEAARIEMEKIEYDDIN